ncbi:MULTISPECIES: bacteriohemerythrin [Clostridium]|uniref:bacteriohemerythrin n=1 Tax=Clostridium TaxID=1485 RepID=UPI00069F03A6|nr:MULTISPECIES: hemerythrin family protein [Clostridium]KOF56524.1 bacteriohemerythrin [Clostridium sp. DMHC 10]MCD2348852.1 hemerythrin family protein [Clostridium guangxiense]
MVQWSEEYVIGIEKIDEQHKRLFEIANEAYKLLKDQFLIDKYDRIVAIIKELKDYTKYHFQYEEEYMKSIGYRKYLSQKVAHDDFIEKINKFDLKKIDNSQDEAILNLLEFVVSWIGLHIQKEDTQIAKA